MEDYELFDREELNYGISAAILTSKILELEKERFISRTPGPSLGKVDLTALASRYAEVLTALQVEKIRSRGTE